MSVFIIPMVGMSSRFFNAGYTKPKYQLDIFGQSMFEWSVSSFIEYFNSETFLFITRDAYDAVSFIQEKISKLGIKKYHIVTLNELTRGQAETVFIGLEKAKIDLSEDIFIFNIDTKLNKFSIPKWYKECQGYLEVFKGKGDHWSFAQIDTNDNVVKTAEKERISDLCSNGLYYFASVSLFNQAYWHSIDNAKFEKGEIYIAPLYNYLIEHGCSIKVNHVNVSDISFSGTPEEYLLLKNGGDK